MAKKKAAPKSSEPTRQLIEMEVLSADGDLASILYKDLEGAQQKETVRASVLRKKIKDLGSRASHFPTEEGRKKMKALVVEWKWLLAQFKAGAGQKSSDEPLSTARPKEVDRARSVDELTP